MSYPKTETKSSAFSSAFRQLKSCSVQGLQEEESPKVMVIPKVLLEIQHEEHAFSPYSRTRFMLQILCQVTYPRLQNVVLISEGLVKKLQSNTSGVSLQVRLVSKSNVSVNVWKMGLSSDLSKDLKAKGNWRYFMQAGSFGAKRPCLCKALCALHSYQPK